MPADANFSVGVVCGNVAFWLLWFDEIETSSLRGISATHFRDSAIINDVTDDFTLHWVT